MTVLKNKANHEDAGIKLTNTQLKKLKSPEKTELETTLRITKTKFSG